MNLINEKDFSKSLYFKELRKNYECNFLKYVKSHYLREKYPKLLLSSENNLLYYNSLIKKTQSIYTKYNYVKLLVQHAELIKKLIINIENLLDFSYTNEIDEINNLKYDLKLFHIFEYQSYKKALDILSEINIFYKSIHKYDILDQIDILNYKTNLSAIEYVKYKFEYNNKISESKRIEEIINNYILSHDDNILNEIKYLEKINIETFKNLSKKKPNNYLLFIILILLCIFFYNENK